MHTLLTFIVVLSPAKAFLFGSLFGGACNPCNQQWSHTSYYQAPQVATYSRPPQLYSYQPPAVAYNTYQAPVPAYNFYQTRNPTYNSHRIPPTPYNPPIEPEGYVSPQPSYTQQSQYQSISDQYATSNDESELPQIQVPTSVQYVATSRDDYAQPPTRRRS